MARTTTEKLQPAASPTGWAVWGHDHAVAELQSAIRHGVRHAYILSGFHQIGKQSLALEFARALVCVNPPTLAIPCGECPACRRAGRGTHPDVTIYDLRTQQEAADKSSTSKNLSLNIQTVRSISSSVSLRPMEARHRVIIVDDVETMQETAQEAFLKTLEEPPSYAVILLLTTDAELLLPTIRSRCTTIQLQSVLSPRIVDALVAAGVGEDEAQKIAVASVGRPGWAFDAANHPDLLTDRVALESSVLSWIRSDQYQRMAEATRLGDAFGKDRNAVYARLSAAQTIWRAAVLHSLGVGDLETLGAVAVDQGSLTPQDVLTALRSVDACLVDLDANVRPRLALQSMVLQWPTLTT
jgi:DNA polymerase III subunit delta'